MQQGIRQEELTWRENLWLEVARIVGINDCDSTRRAQE